LQERSKMTSTPQNSCDVEYDVFQKTCEQVMESDKFTFVWEITNFSSRGEANGEFLNSKEFTINGPGNKSSKLLVRVYPRGHRKVKKNSDSVSVFLYNDTDDDLFLKFAVYYVKLNNIKQKYYESDNMITIQSHEDFGWFNFFKRTNMDQYAPDGTLKLIFQITILETSDESVEFVDDKSNNNLVLSQNYHRDQHFQDLEQVFSSKLFADVTIKCGDKTFECHKIILASRSNVFKAMFESNMKEGITGCVEIENIVPEVFENLLQYIYTCEVLSTFHKMAKELLVAADQYEVDKLKELCEEKLISAIAVENCMDLLVFGEMYQVSKLKAKALKFVAQNIGNFDSNEWKETLMAYPSLMAEVMEMMMPKPKRKSSDDDDIEG